MLHVPMIVMLALLGGAILLALRHGTLGRAESIVLFIGSPVFVAISSI